MVRRSLLKKLASSVQSIRADHPVRVAIDGPDTAGKTTLADELAKILQDSNREVLRASSDNFHHPKSIRYRRGSLSPEGYFLDSFDYDALFSSLLAPLGPGGSRRYRLSSFDHLLDEPVSAPEQLAAGDAILLFDGLFLLRPFLLPYWEFSITIQVTKQEILKRAMARDGESLGGPEKVRERYLTRYLPAQELYLAECCPAKVASIVVDNENPEGPFLVPAS